MRRKNIKFIILSLCVLVLVLVACNADKKIINGRYIKAVDNSIYYDFSDNGTYVTNNLFVFSEDSLTGSYTLENNELILFINGKSNVYMNMGYLYKDYICSIWNGTLPENYTDAMISYQFSNDFIIHFSFKEDKTYEYISIRDDDINYTEKGTYSINGNTVTCVSENNVTITFINTDQGIYGIEYIKE